MDRRDGSDISFKLNPCDLAGASLRKLRSADISRQDIGIAVNAHGFLRSGILRLEPCSRCELQNARHELIAQGRGCKATAAAIGQSDDIAVRNSSRMRVFRVDANGLTIPDLFRATECPIVQLTVQPLMGLVTDEMERVKRDLI